MDFRVFYTEPALADLEDVMRWSWHNHPGNTERFANALLNHIDLLSSYPFLGAPVRRYAGVRRLQHSPLQVYYKLFPESAVLIRQLRDPAHLASRTQETAPL